MATTFNSRVPIGKQRGYELARASNGGTGKKRERLSDSDPPSQYSALNSVNGAPARRFRASLAYLLPHYLPFDRGPIRVCKSESSKLLFTKERGREMGWLREVRVINLSLSLLSLLYLDQFVSAASRNYTDQTERERELGALARSLKAEWSRQQ